MDHNPIPRMQRFYNLLHYTVFNIYVGKEQMNIDFVVNLTFWTLKISKDVFRWILSITYFSETKFFFFFLFIPSVLKFVLISIYGLRKFYKHFNGIIPLVIIMTLFLLVESFAELPMHLFFPENKIYLHTNYYYVYDNKKKMFTNCIIEILECAFIMAYLINFFVVGNLHYSAFVLIILDCLCLIIFVISLIITIIEKKKKVDEDHKEIVEEEEMKDKNNESKDVKISTNKSSNKNNANDNSEFRQVTEAGVSFRDVGFTKVEDDII